VVRLAVTQAVGVVLFCAVGALLGRIADSRDGVIAAANAVGFPLLFLSETFVSPAMLPAWFRPAVAASPLTYFARGVRGATAPGLQSGGDPLLDLAVLSAFAAAVFLVGAYAIPWTD